MKTMKNMPMRLIGALALVLMVAFNSCKEDEGVITPQFPELKEALGQPGDTLDITFNANLDWSIQSSAAWCKFVNGEFAETTSSGKAGAQTLKISISDESWNYQTEDVAELTLKMVDQTQVIYKILRAKKEYQDLVVVDSEGNKVGESFVIKGNTGSVTYSSLKASAEKGVKIGVEYPEWLIMTYNSASGYYDFTFNTDKETNGELDFRDPYDDGQSFITFVTEDAETAETDKIRKVSIPVSYEGFNKETVLIEPSYMNITVSYDGKVNVDGKELTALTSEITAFENDFEIIIGEQIAKEVNGENVYEYDFSKKVDWVSVSREENSSEIKVTFDEFIPTENSGINKDYSIFTRLSDISNKTGLRSAVAFVLPRKIYEEAETNLKNYLLDENGEIKSSLNTFILFTAEQEEKVSAADEITFKVRCCAFIDFYGKTFYDLSDFDESLKGERFNFSSISGDELTAIKNEYGLTTTNVYKTSVTSGLLQIITQEMLLVFEADGMGDDQKMEILTKNSDINAQNVTGDVYSSVGNYSVSGMAIGSNSIGEQVPDIVDLAIKNPDNTIAAFCRIEFSK